MYINDGYLVPIIPLQPQGTNSTFFTYCCEVAICDDEACCPVCGREVVGASEETNHAWHRVRWANATSHWKR